MTKAHYTNQGIRIGKRLSCGCCGLDFKTRPAYLNQDQGSGYGICKECQGESVFNYTREIDSLFDKILNFYKETYEETKPYLICSYREMLFPEREQAVLRFIRNKIRLTNFETLQISTGMANHLSLYKLI